MSHRVTALLALTLAALPLAAADKPAWNLEQAIEARASAVVLPSSLGGTLVVTPCAACPPKSFVTTARTRYLTGSEPVTLAALRAAFAVAPRAALTVFYDAHSREITRVVTSAATASPVAPVHGDRHGAQR